MYKQIILLILFGLTIIFISCNEDDNSEPDFVIGEWQQFLAFGEGKFFESSDCQKQGRITFENNGVYSGSTYLETVNDDNEIECSLIDSGTGSWIKLSENSYEISVDIITDTVTIIKIHSDTIRFQPDENNYAELVRISN